MKFTCTQMELAKAINIVIKAVSSRTTIPILKGILLELKGDILTLTASDLDISIETKIQVSGHEDGAIVVQAKLFSEIIRKFPNALISFNKDEENNASLTCLSSNFVITSFPAEDFPAIGSVEPLRKAKLLKGQLKNLIRRTTFASSIDEKKGILTGCLIEFKRNSTVMVGLDGFRMAVIKEPSLNESEFSIVMPSRILNEVYRIISENDSDEDGEVNIVVDEKKAEIRRGDIRIIGRLLEGDFIKYKDILPKELKTKCVINREELLASIERASLLAREGKNNLIKISVEERQLEITSRSEEGNIREEIESIIDGEGLVIGFNSKYIMDAIRAVEDEEIVMEFTTATSPAIVRPVEGEAYTYLILPVRIMGY